MADYFLPEVQCLKLANSPTFQNYIFTNPSHSARQKLRYLVDNYNNLDVDFDDEFNLKEFCGLVSNLARSIRPHSREAAYAILAIALHDIEEIKFVNLRKTKKIRCDLWVQYAKWNGLHRFAHLLKTNPDELHRICSIGMWKIIGLPFDIKIKIPGAYVS